MTDDERHALERTPEPQHWKPKATPAPVTSRRMTDTKHKATAEQRRIELSNAIIEDYEKSSGSRSFLTSSPVLKKGMIFLSS